MKTPYGLEISDTCVDCVWRSERLFCNLPLDALRTFDTIKYTSIYREGSVLFVEGQAPRGIYLICSGRVKLTATSSEGKCLIMRIAGPGQIVGLSGTLSGRPYRVTAETLEPSQLNFVKRDDFLRFVQEHGEACFRAALQLADDFHTSYEQIRSLGLSRSASEKLAKLLLGWSNGAKETPQGIRLRILLTHEEIAQMIGTSRETVTRLLSDFKSHHIIEMKGSTMIIRDKEALERLATS